MNLNNISVLFKNDNIFFNVYIICKDIIRERYELFHGESIGLYNTETLERRMNCSP